MPARRGASRPWMGCGTCCKRLPKGQVCQDALARNIACKTRVRESCKGPLIVLDTCCRSAPKRLGGWRLAGLLDTSQNSCANRPCKPVDRPWHGLQKVPGRWFAWAHRSALNTLRRAARRRSQRPAPRPRPRPEALPPGKPSLPQGTNRPLVDALPLQAVKPKGLKIKSREGRG